MGPQATLSVLVEAQGIAKAAKDIGKVDTILMEAAQSANESAAKIDAAGGIAGAGFAAGISKGVAGTDGDFAKAASAADTASSAMGAAGVKGGKGFAAGAAVAKTAGVDLDAVAAGATQTAAKMGVAGDRGGSGFATGIKGGVAKAQGAFGPAVAAANGTAGDMGSAGDRGGSRFAAGVSSGVDKVRGAFGGAITAASSAASRIGAEGNEAGSGFAAGLKDKLKMGGAAAGAAGAGALGAGFLRSVSIEAASDKLDAQLGATGNRAGRAGKIAGDLFKGAWGGSMEEAGQAVVAVQTSLQGFGNASDRAVKRASAQALNLASAFGVDVDEAVLGVGVTMRTGLAPNATRAFDLITTASQRVPVALKGDIAEAAHEYGVNLAGLGFSGKEAFAVLVDAAQMGRFALDKVGDSGKEFTLQVGGMSTGAQEAYEAIGLDAGKMADMVAKGGASSKKALRQTIDGLLAIESPSKRMRESVKLFGTPLEDLGAHKIPQFLRAMRGTSDSMDGLAGGSKRLGATLNDNVATRFIAFKNTLQVGLTTAFTKHAIPAMEKAYGVLKAIGGPIGDVVGWFGRHKTATIALAAVMAPLVAALGLYVTGVVAAKIATIALGVGIAVMKGVVIALSVATKVAAAAQWLLNAALLANPIGAIVLLVAALVAGFVLAWKNSDTFRNIVTGAWNAIWSATKTVFGAIRGYLGAVFGVYKKIFATLFGAYKAIVEGTWGAIKGATKAVWGAIKSVLSTVFGAIKSGVTTYFNAYKAVVTGVWNAIKAVTSTIWNGLKRFLGSAWNAIKAVASTAWQGVKTVIVNPVRATWSWMRSAVGNVREWLAGAWSTIRERASAAWQNVRGAITGPIRGAFDSVRTAVGNVRGWLAGAWADIRGRAGDAWGNIKGTIVDAFQGALRGVGRIVNAIIGVVNKIPGVDIGKVSWGGLAQGGTASKAGIEGAQALAKGGKVTRPMALIGEEAPAHPEWVIPENPAYRTRALGLFAQLGSKLGVPGYAVGGVIGDVGRTVTAPGRAALGLLGKGAGWFIDQLPSPSDYLPKWLTGLGSHVINKVSAWIKDKVASLIPKSGPGGGPLNLVGRLTGTNAKAAILARAFGQTITSGYRSPEHNAAVGGVAGSSHTKGTPSNPGAHDFYPPVSAALNAAMAMGASWVDIHDFGSGPHNHVTWFAKGGVLDKMGGPALPKAVASAPYLGSYKTGGPIRQDGLAYVHRGETVEPAGARVHEGPLVVIEEQNFYGDDGHDEERMARQIAHRLRAEGVIA